jgi:hypothetical protein
VTVIGLSNVIWTTNGYHLHKGLLVAGYRNEIGLSGSSLSDVRASAVFGESNVNTFGNSLVSGQNNRLTGGVGWGSIVGGRGHLLPGYGENLTFGALCTNSIVYGIVGGWAVQGGAGATYYNSVGYGDYCRVVADDAWAIGSRAKVNHKGSFVWASPAGAQFSDTAPFGSSGTNQFLVRAQGGVGFGLTNPTAGYISFAMPIEVDKQSGVSRTNAVLIDAGGGLWTTQTWIFVNGIRTQ